MPENPTTESNFETELIQIARNHLSRLQQRYRDNEMQAAVRNWRERMEPILAMEEEREQFNIRRTIKRIDECLVDRQVNPPNINENSYCSTVLFYSYNFQPRIYPQCENKGQSPS